MPKTMSITVDGLHTDDVLVKGDTRWWVHSVHKKGSHVFLTTLAYGEPYTQVYRLERSHLVDVQVEHPCTCEGTGIFRGGGVVENGVYKGYEGKCFACNGKGHQDRKDVIRNHVYWSKYARI